MKKAGRKLHPSAARLYAVAAEQPSPVVGQSAVARWLNESPQLVTNWEARGVSRRGALKAQEATGYSATWILTGEGPDRITPAPSHAPAPSYSISPQYQQLLMDLDDLPPSKRSRFIDMIHQAAEDARESALHLAAKQDALEKANATRVVGRHVATVSWGDGNARQASLPLATVPDPFTAAPTERESALYNKIGRAPREPKGKAASEPKRKPKPRSKP